MHAGTASYRHGRHLMLAASSLAIAIAVPQAAMGQALPAECDPDFAIAGARIVCVAPAPDEIGGISTNVDDLTVVVGDDDTPTLVRNPAGDGVRMVGEGAQTLHIANSGSQVSGGDGATYADGAHVAVTGGVGDQTVVAEGIASGTDNGIEARNAGGGAIAINASETSGTYGNGVNARGSGTDLTIVAQGPAQGGINGILALNSGRGITDISAGDTYGGYYDGIAALGYGTDLRISSTGTAIGQRSGLYAINAGSGDLSVDAVDVTGRSGDALLAVNLAGGGNLSVTTAGQVTGQYDGITALQYGSGNVSIDAIDVTATRLSAIRVGAVPDAGGISIASSGTIRSGYWGVYLLSYTDQATSISANDIDAYGAGIQASIRSEGDLDISVAGAIDTSLGDGIWAAVHGGDLAISSTGAISAGQNGIKIFQFVDGSASVLVNEVSAVWGDGIRFESDTRSEGDLTIAATGTVSGRTDGISVFSEHTGSVRIEAQDVYSSDYGGSGVIVTAWNASDFEINVAGTASGRLSGITGTNRGPGALTITANNAYANNPFADIAIGIHGINDRARGPYQAGTTDLTITSTGTASGTVDGIAAINWGTGFTSVTSARALGEKGQGIRVETAASATDLTIVSTERAEGAVNGIGVKHEGSGSLTIEATDTYGGNGAGITLLAEAGMTDLSVLSTGLAEGGQHGIYAYSYGSGAVTLSAQDTHGHDGFGIFLNAEGTDISVTSTGLAQGRDAGIAVVGYNSGDTTILAHDSLGSDGVGLLAETGSEDGSLDIRSTGTARGGYAGILVQQQGNGSVSLVSEGEASGDYYGIAVSTERAQNTSIQAVDTYATYGDAIILSSLNGGEASITSTGTANGGRSGIYALHTGSGALTIAAVETRGANEAGIVAGSAGGSLSISSTGAALGGTKSYEYAGLRELEAIADRSRYPDLALGIGGFNRSHGTLTIAANEAYGRNIGIAAINDGSDAVITATGDVYGDIGIAVVNRGENADLLIDAADTTGLYTGIKVRNGSAGNMAFGAATILSGYAHGVYIGGIDAVSYGSDLTIISTDYAWVAGTQPQETFEFDAIRASNYGTGALTIEANDTRAPATAIRAAGYGTDLTITSTGHTAAGYRGIDARNYGSGATLVHANSVNGFLFDGILARSSGSGLDVVVEDIALGSRFGVVADNLQGELRIDAFNTEGVTTAGIFARNARGLAGTDLTVISRGLAQGGVLEGPGLTLGEVNTSTASGFISPNAGIAALNFGSGATIIDAHDTLGGGYGIAIIGSGTDLAVTSTGLAQGGLGGIAAANLGTGAMSVTAQDTQGGAISGIGATSFGADLTITSLGVAQGGANGILGYHGGSGALTINAASSYGAAYQGISAYGAGTGVTVTSSGMAEGGLVGISAYNSGSGVLRIDAVDTAGGLAGISARNLASATDLIVTSTGTALAGNGAPSDLTLQDLLAFDGSVANSPTFAVGGYNQGTGTLTINANETKGDDLGIAAINNGGSASVSSTGTAQGGFIGVGALNNGSADLTIATEDAAGTSFAGIFALNFGADLAISSTGFANGGAIGIGARQYGHGAVSVSAGNAAGGAYGIAVSSLGGDVSIATSGEVAGGFDGINASASAGRIDIQAGGTTYGGRYGVAIGAGTSGPVTITNSGQLGGGAAAIALLPSGDAALPDPAVSLTNSGLVTGRLALGAGDDLIESSGLFVAEGTSEFGGGADLFRNSGTFAVRGEVTLSGLELFANLGAITMVDGASDDTLVLASDYSAGSTLAVEADLAAGRADKLVVGGAIDGVTHLLITNLDATRDFGNFAAIVEAGQAIPAGAFIIDPASDRPGAFLDFALATNDAGELGIVGTLADAAFRPLKLAGMGRDMWFSSTQAVALATEQARDGEERSRFWFQVRGGSADRDSTVKIDRFGPVQNVSLDYRTDYRGIQFGVNLFDGEVLSGGVTAGWLEGDLDFDGSGDGAAFDSSNIGAYLALTAGNLFASVIAKYDMMDLDLRQVSEAASADLDGSTLGARGELGYRLESGSFFFEPSATLEFASSDIEDYNLAGAGFSFDRFEGWRLGGGARLGIEYELGSYRLVTHLSGEVLHELDPQGRLLFSSGTTTTQLDNEFEDTLTRIGLGFMLSGAGPVSAFAQAEYADGSDTSGYGVTLGASVKF